MTDLTPITRLEYDLDGIVNNHSLLDPITRVEMYLSDIAAGRVSSLSPITRIEMYLAKISGASVGVPAPITRIEMYLAAIAGEDVETPDPITRVEYWLDQWADQSGSGVITTVTGTSPLALANALDKSIRKLIQYGKVTTSDGDMYCNNGKLVAVGDELSVVGTPEVLTVGEQTATVENLFAVDDIADEQNIISGTIARRCEAVVSDGTTPSGRYIGEVGDGNIIVKVRETGYEGDVATFEADSAKPLNGLTVNVEPIQDLHGYDSPWPAGGGVNKLPNSLATSVSNNGVTMVSDGNGKYTLSGTATAQTVLRFPLVNSYVIPTSVEQGGNGVAYFNNSVSAPSVLAVLFYNGNTQVESWSLASINRSSSSYVAMAGKTIDGIGFQIPNGWSSGGTFSPMIVENGSTTAQFAPYSNICPISGRTSATVTRTGKNLLNPNDCVDGMYIAANNMIFQNISGASVYYAFVKPNTTYSLSADKGDRTVVCSCNAIPANNGEIKRLILNAGTFTLPKTFTTAADEAIIAIYVNRNAETKPTQIQLELGSTASAYEPYQGNTYTIALGDTVYGGTLDVTQGKMVVDMAELVPTALKQGAYAAGGRFYPWVALPFLSVNYSQGFCDKLKCARTFGQLFANVSFMVRQEYLSLNLSGAGYESAVDAIAAGNAFIANNDVQFVYPLAQPFEITLTPTQIETLLGTNNIWSDAGRTVKAYVANGDVIEHVTAQPMRAAEGSNTVSVTSAVAPVQLSATYTRSEP